ncbi:MAG: hypothetical protein KBC66_11170 [Kiritimatiellae bacterium]|nr:hypothetical protein [Kiritimatiellia bacterium]
MEIEHRFDIARLNRVFRRFCLGNDAFQKFEPAAVALLQLGDGLGQPVLVQEHLLFPGRVLAPADIALKERVEQPVQAGLQFSQLRLLAGKDRVCVLRLALLKLINPALPLVQPVAKPGLAGFGGKLAGQDFFAGVLQGAWA